MRWRCQFFPTSSSCKGQPEHPQAHLACTQIRTHTDHLHYPCPLQYFLLKLEKCTSMEDKAAFPSRSSTDSKTSTFLSVQIPSIQRKASHKPRVSERLIASQGLSNSLQATVVGRRDVKQGREWKGEIQVHMVETVASAGLVPLLLCHTLGCPCWGHALRIDDATDPAKRNVLELGMGFIEPSTHFLSTLSCLFSHQPIQEQTALCPPLPSSPGVSYVVLTSLSPQDKDSESLNKTPKKGAHLLSHHDGHGQYLDLRCLV